jgi:hypothetical protein
LLLIRGILAALRQKFHLSACPNLAGHLYPQTYFADLLTRLVNGWPQKRIDELMPWNWTPQQTA